MNKRRGLPSISTPPAKCSGKDRTLPRTAARSSLTRGIAMPAALLVLALSTAALFAQDKMSGAEVFGGYQFARFSDGIAVKDLNGNGWDAGFAYYFSRWLGAKADFSGSYATDDTSSGSPFRVTNYTYTFGPVVSLRNRGHFAPFGQFLFGGYHETLAGYPNSDSGFAMLAEEGSTCTFVLISRCARPKWIGSILVPPTPPY